MRYRLRTLLILLAVVPPLVWFSWTKFTAWRAEEARQRAIIAAAHEDLSVQLLGNRSLTPIQQTAAPPRDSVDMEHSEAPGETQE